MSIEKNQNGFGVIAVALVLLVIGLVAVITWKVLEGSQPATFRDGQKSIISEDEKVEAAAKAFCQAQIDDKGDPFVFTLGTSGPSAKKILYSSNKIFASINVRCAPASQIGGGTGYILKKTNDNWTVITQGTQENPEATKMYGIPNDFN